ncbi:MAG: hypothetical protein B6I34_00225 [Anaerolineaceae bacterium 4572_32.1]|nr:MAG: hypothetical protein B6I34_00225 [Anaerolineaceae bacterium 4572_32.1]
MAATKKKPIQVYLDRQHLNLLGQLVESLSLSQAEVLRRGLESLAREVVPVEDDPAWQLIGLAGEDVDLPEDWSINHDHYLTEWTRNE